MKKFEIRVNGDVEHVSVNDFFSFSVKYHDVLRSDEVLQDGEKTIIRRSAFGIWLIGDNEFFIGENDRWRNMTDELSFFLDRTNPDSMLAPISLKMLFVAIADSVRNGRWKASSGASHEHSIRIDEIARRYTV